MSWFLSWLLCSKSSFFLLSPDTQVQRNYNVLVPLLTTLGQSSFFLLSPEFQAPRNHMSWFSSWPLCDKVVISSWTMITRFQGIIRSWFLSFDHSVEEYFCFPIEPDTQAPRNHEVLILSWPFCDIVIFPGWGQLPSSIFTLEEALPDRRMFIHSLTLWDHRREPLVAHIGFHQSPDSEP